VLFYDIANGYPKTDLKRRENSDDAKLLRFMAEKTINSTEMSSEDKEVALASKYDVIDEMFEMATPGRACFREKLLNYFRDPADKKPRGFVIWLVSFHRAQGNRKCRCAATTVIELPPRTFKTLCTES